MRQRRVVVRLQPPAELTDYDPDEWTAPGDKGPSPFCRWLEARRAWIDKHGVEGFGGWLAALRAEHLALMGTFEQREASWGGAMSSSRCSHRNCWCSVRATGGQPQAPQHGSDGTMHASNTYSSTAGKHSAGERHRCDFRRRAVAPKKVDRACRRGIKSLTGRSISPDL